jgi:hypothetical protein
MVLVGRIEVQCTEERRRKGNAIEMAHGSCDDGRSLEEGKESLERKGILRA